MSKGKWKINVEIEETDLGTLCICALRYCMGRQSYMPSLVRGIVRSLLPQLTDRDIDVMLDDCRHQGQTHLWGDERIDKSGWLVWRHTLEEEKNRRADNG